MPGFPSAVRQRLGLLLPIALCIPVHARLLEVGPGKPYAKPSLAAAAVRKGDTVSIAPGLYAGDVCAWRVDDLILRATAPYAHLRADDAHSGGKGTWVISGSRVTVENIEFSGSRVPDDNGAGIRHEGGDLTVRHCSFHGNQNGILTGAGTGNILIEYSSFAGNGAGDGYSHNMYIGNVAGFTLRYCRTQKAKVGHNIKSRAAVNHILYNISDNGADGTSSYELDLPDGGFAYVIGNVFQQSPGAENPTLLSYGAESLGRPGKELYVVNNTFVNDRFTGTFLKIAEGAAVAVVRNNLFVGEGTPISGKAADTAANLQTQSPGFVARASGDYRLASGSAALDKGKDPGQAGDLALTPTRQYKPEADGMDRPVRGALDLGAFEYDSGARIRAQRAEEAAGAERRWRFVWNDLSGASEATGATGAAGWRFAPPGSGPESVQDALGRRPGPQAFR